MTSKIATKHSLTIEFKLKESGELLKTVIKSNKVKFETYNELEQKFDEISLKLKELKLCEEYNYFLSISDYILYIIRQNSIDTTFGHYNYAVKLFKFFMEFFKTNMNFYESLSRNYEKITMMKHQFEEQYWEYRSQFYCEIYQTTGDFTEEEMYKIHKSLRG